MSAGEHLALGVTGRWLQVEQAQNAGVFGIGGANPLTTTDLPADGTPNNGIFNTLTFDVGATASFSGFRLGVVGHNLTSPGPLAPATGAAGMGYANETFALEMDGLLDFTTFGHTTGRWMARGEAFLADHYAVRLGWRYDSGTNLHAPSLGFGYIDPRWSVELGVRRDLRSDHGETYGLLSLRYFYDAGGASDTPADQPDGL